MEPNFFSIQQISEMTGLTVHTLRYYEKIGLLYGIHRDTSGYRQYSETDISWVHFLLRLRVTGMKVSDMKHFSDLRSQGEATISARRELLETHQKNVLAQINELKNNLKMIDEKIESYKWMEGQDSKEQCLFVPDN
ncbi:MerR family transcriptional regulator [Paenibacillus sp. FSL L8-0340]|uniref:MerR family transcriptional regulator n=1 Tax=Paenibacillus sp. FSL L8-0340 TaxID=2954685 RepID=UPI003158EFE2